MLSSRSIGVSSHRVCFLFIVVILTTIRSCSGFLATASGFRDTRPWKHCGIQMNNRIPANALGSPVDNLIVEVLSHARTIAVVGATNRESMPVHSVMKYLIEQVLIPSTTFTSINHTCKSSMQACTLSFFHSHTLPPCPCGAHPFIFPRVRGTNAFQSTRTRLRRERPFSVSEHTPGWRIYQWRRM